MTTTAPVQCDGCHRWVVVGPVLRDGDGKPFGPKCGTARGLRTRRVRVGRHRDTAVEQPPLEGLEQINEGVMDMTETYMVTQPHAVGNPQDGYGIDYSSDGVQSPSREQAIAHGLEVNGHDDWLILRLEDGKAAGLSWMHEDRDDPDELASVARALSLELGQGDARPEGDR